MSAGAAALRVAATAATDVALTDWTSRTRDLPVLSVGDLERMFDQKVAARKGFEELPAANTWNEDDIDVYHEMYPWLLGDDASPCKTLLIIGAPGRGKSFLAEASAWYERSGAALRDTVACSIRRRKSMPRGRGCEIPFAIAIGTLVAPWIDTSRSVLICSSLAITARLYRSACTTHSLAGVRPDFQRLSASRDKAETVSTLPETVQESYHYKTAVSYINAQRFLEHNEGVRPRPVGYFEKLKEFERLADTFGAKIADCETLTVDECSREDPRLFDHLERLFAAIKEYKTNLTETSDLLFGGVSLRICGDFLQLAPPTRRMLFSAPWCSFAKAFDAGTFRVIVMLHNRRQKEMGFSELIDELRTLRRSDRLSSRAITILQKRALIGAEPGCLTSLFGTGCERMPMVISSVRASVALRNRRLYHAHVGEECLFPARYFLELRVSEDSPAPSPPPPSTVAQNDRGRGWRGGWRPRPYGGFRRGRGRGGTGGGGRESVKYQLYRCELILGGWAPGMPTAEKLLGSGATKPNAPAPTFGNRKIAYIGQVALDMLLAKDAARVAVSKFDSACDTATTQKDLESDTHRRAIDALTDDKGTADVALKCGIPVVNTSNTSMKAGLVNGARFRFIRSTDPAGRPHEYPVYYVADLQRHLTGGKARSQLRAHFTGHKRKSPGNDSSNVAVGGPEIPLLLAPVADGWHDPATSGRGAVVHDERNGTLVQTWYRSRELLKMDASSTKLICESSPMQHDWSRTTDRTQGSTQHDGAVVDLERMGWRAAEFMVAVSRVTSLQKLHLLNFDRSRFEGDWKNRVAYCDELALEFTRRAEAISAERRAAKHAFLKRFLDNPSLFPLHVPAVSLKA